jgi:hypothetical protein
MDLLDQVNPNGQKQLIQMHISKKMPNGGMDMMDKKLL